MNGRLSDEFFQTKAALFICENALMRQLYWCDKSDEKQKNIQENLQQVNMGNLSDTLKALKETVLEEAQIDEKTAVKHFKTAWEFYYQAEMNDRLSNDPIYKQLKENQAHLDEKEKIALDKIEQELENSATSNAKGVDITKPVTVVQWDQPCAQYNPIDRPGRYFFPLEKSITEPTKLGTLSVNIWTVIGALKNQGSSLRPLTPYQPIKPILALQSVASATIDHWSLSHPGDKRPVITLGGADQLFMPFPRKKDPKESKQIFDTMMKVLPQSVLEEGLYKDLEKENSKETLEQRVKKSAVKKIEASVTEYHAKRNQKWTIYQLRHALAAQIDMIDMALCFAAEQEQIFKNTIINNQGEKSYNELKKMLSSRNNADLKISFEQKKDLTSLREISAFKNLMKKRKEQLEGFFKENTPVEELKTKINNQSNYITQEINDYRNKTISVSQPKKGLWNMFLRKIGWIKENPRQAIAFAAASVFTGGLAAKMAAIHLLALGTYKIAVGLVAGSAAAASMKSTSESVKTMLNHARPMANASEQKTLPAKNILTVEEKEKLPSAHLDAKQQANLTYSLGR